ncbi:hypothetical protein PFISCL1PPCAC_26169, partial [Pristionchus fissidentatus]
FQVSSLPGRSSSVVAAPVAASSSLAAPAAREMSDHSGHHGDAATTVATAIANATSALASDVVNSDLAHDVSDFLAALAPAAAPAAAGAHAGHAMHEGHGAAHDHGAMAGHHMMKMWFHGGVDEVILFDWWRTDSCLSLLVSCVIIFAMGALYEGVKWFRVYLQMNSQKAKNNSACDETPAKAGGCGGDHVPLRDVTEEQNGFGPTATPPVTRRGIRIAAGSDGPFSVFRLVEAALYSLQLVLAYWLMLIVMTYNTWLAVAVIAGAAFGHWLFAILNILSPSGDRHDSFTTDACH